MPKRALIVAGSAGPDEVVTGVLQRFGFAAATQSPTLDEALALVSNEHFDLVIVPLGDIEPVQLITLERHIRKGTGTSVLGTASRADPDLIVRAMRSGIDEFLVYPPDSKDLTAAVDRLMRRSRSDTQRGQVVAVYSSKGGLGTTSIAVNLAQEFAKHRADARVALVDLVVAGGDVRVFLNLRPAYDLGDLVAKLDHVDADLLYSLLTPRPGGVWALPSGDAPELDEMINGSTIASILEQLRTHFAFTVLDCEHHLSERTVAAMDAADRLLVITQLSVPALRGAQRTLALCRRLGYPDEKLCMIVNRFQSGEVLSLRDASEALKCEIFWTLPNEYKISLGALNKGVPVAELEPTSKLALSYAQLAAKLDAGTAAAGSRNGRHGSSRLRQLFGIRKGGI